MYNVQRFYFCSVCSSELSCIRLADQNLFIYQPLWKHSVLLVNTNAFLWKMWPWNLTLTRTDDLELYTKEKVVPQGIQIWNMKALSLTNKKLWQIHTFIKDFGNRWTNREIKETGQKLYAPYLSMQGHKNSHNFLVSLSTIAHLTVHVYRTSLLKILWEKEKLLETSNFSFSHSIFYPFEELSTSFLKYEIVICKPFQFWSVLNLLFGKGLKVTL